MSAKNDDAEFVIIRSLRRCRGLRQRDARRPIKFDCPHHESKNTTNEQGESRGPHSRFHVDVSFPRSLPRLETQTATITIYKKSRTRRTTQHPQNVKDAISAVLAKFEISPDGLRDLQTDRYSALSATYVARPRVDYSCMAGIGRPGTVKTWVLFVPLYEFISGHIHEDNDRLVTRSSSRWGTPLGNGLPTMSTKSDITFRSFPQCVVKCRSMMKF